MKLRSMLLIVVLVSLLAIAFPIHAQEVTETPVVTVTPAPPGNTPGTIQVPELVGAIFAVLTFLAVGFAAGRYNPGEIARKMEQDKMAMDSAERIALNTIPLPALETIRGIIKDGRDVLDLAGKLLDGQPNDPPPDVPTA